MRALPLAVLSIGLLVPSGASAQAASSLVGTWERVSQRDSAGVATQPPNPAAFTTFTASGQYSTVGMPAGRPKVQKRFADMTKDELLAIVQRANAHRGTYSVSGSTLTRKTLTSLDPNAEGTDIIQNFKVTGDTLTLRSVNPTSRAEARWVRVR